MAGDMSVRGAPIDGSKSSAESTESLTLGADGRDVLLMQGKAWGKHVVIRGNLVVLLDCSVVATHVDVAAKILFLLNGSEIDTAHLRTGRRCRILRDPDVTEKVDALLARVGIFRYKETPPTIRGRIKAFFGSKQTGVATN